MADGVVDHALATGRPHRCTPPRIRDFGPARDGIPTTVIRHPVGTRFHCDGCGTVLVVYYRAGGRVGNLYIAGGHEWRRESRQERRRRLGLRWWQRG